MAAQGMKTASRARRGARPARSDFRGAAAIDLGPVQRKLKLGRTNDPLEAQADRVAAQVMGASAPAVSITAAPAALRRKGPIGQPGQTKDGISSEAAGASSAQALDLAGATLRSAGRPLGDAARAFFEPRFGHDFSAVRIHDGPSAHDSAARLDARAYTVGQSIVFGRGEYAPGTSDGRRLLAHELTHVVQQSGAVAPNHGARLNAFGATAVGHPQIARAPAETLARYPRGDGMTDEERDDRDYRQQEAEDKAQEARKQVRGGRAKADAPPTGGQVSRRAGEEIQGMIGDAKRGAYRHSNPDTRLRETNRFRSQLEKYHGTEIQRIDDALAKLPKSAANKTARSALVRKKMTIVVERSGLMGQFDEAMRTPAGVEVQQPYVRGGKAHDYHDTEPGRGSYAQPDYSELTFERGKGVTQVHVNLKSNDLRDLTPADARAVAREVMKQAVKNVRGDPKKVGSVGHLPAGDELVISFIDQPPKEIQDEMSKILVDEKSPIAEVRFGTAARRNPTFARPAPKPPTSGGDAGVPKGSAGEEPPMRPAAPKGSAFEEHTPRPAAPKGSAFEQSPGPKTTESPSSQVVASKAPASAQDLPEGITSKRVGRATVDIEVDSHGGVRGRVKAIDLSDMPEHDIPLGPRSSGARMQTAMQLGQAALMAVSIAREAASEETQDKIDHVITPIQAHFNDKLKDAWKAFNTTYPDAQDIIATAQVEEGRKGYDAAILKMQMPQAERVAWATMLALTPENKRDANWYQMAANLPKGSVRNEDVKAAQSASEAYSLAMADAQTQLFNLRTDLPAIVADISARAAILQHAGNDLEEIFWFLIRTPLMAHPMTYFEALKFYNEAQVFKRFAGGFYGLAREVQTKLDGYDAAWSALDRRHLAIKTFD